MIAAYCHGYGFTGVVYRFVSILGERYTHGHVYRLLPRAQARPDAPARPRRRPPGEVLPLRAGLRAGILDRRSSAHAGEPGFGVYNLGTDETLVVDESVARITARLGVAPEIEHTGGARGWAGDSPLIHLDCAKIRGLGWRRS